MTKGCEKCRLVPAGISKKTGKEYDAFYSCDNPDCPNFKPQKGQYGPKKAVQPSQDITIIARRLDNMAQYLDEKFEEIMTKLIDLDRK